ncbi:hypothetical protein LL912_03685 [Niabella sp. CC-SYL272]|uniref:hypothetical protein n=1 Tax=Niabella agricola TaxID=2891571 RepID=UPI001F257753|nr:hypothetical protein [Niabella agricola]MCF3107872.1 hypothetical protein [Niabella agricola]
MRCRLKNKHWLGMLLLGLMACNGKPTSMKRPELEAYIRNPGNGLQVEQVVNGIKAQLVYFPSDFLKMQEKEANSGADTISQKANTAYDSMYYFKLKYSIQDKEAIRQLGSFNRYSEMLQVLAFRMGQYINLTTPARDTLPVADYFFDQTYGMSNGNTLLLCFPKSGLERAAAFDINIAECGFGTGALKFRFEKDDIEATPRLAGL